MTRRPPEVFRTAEPPFSLARSQQRQAFVADLVGAALAEGWAVDTFREYDGDHTVNLKGPELAVMVCVQKPRRRGETIIPTLHWHGAERHLGHVEGAWNLWDVNPYHHRKATSFPLDLEDTIVRLVNGIKAANDGTAFKALEPTR
jgi:hypothetical protein